MTCITELPLHGYEEVRQIGQGRFGSVYQVRCAREIQRMFVCKLIVLDSLGDADRRLAEQEANLLRALDHRSIVRFEDLLRLGSGTSLGLIMEYCDGGDLRHAIREQIQVGVFFPEKQVMAWFSQILEGLRYVHAHRIIHRDLKTSNIFLKGPAPFRCLIGDFGISRVLEGTLSSAHTVIGTPYYLSPEVCKREAYTTKSDMWSLGAVLYEMVMLKMAFKCSSLLSLVSRIIHEAYEPVDSKHFSPEISSLISRLLKKNPEERPSAADIVKEPYISQFADDNTDKSPQVLGLVGIKRRPTLKGRAFARSKLSISIPEEIVEEPPVLEELHQELKDPEISADSDSLLIPSRPASAGPQSIPPPPPLFF